MKKMPYVCLYTSYLQQLSIFTDAQRGRLLTGLLQYLDTGEAPVFKGSERYIWPTLQAQLDRDLEAYQARCQKNRENALKRVKKEEAEQQAAIAAKEKENEKENENEKEKEKKKEKRVEQGTLADKPPVRPRFVPPSENEVREYITRMGYCLDAEHFLSYYTSNGWRVGRNPMKDWRAAVRTWNAKEKKNGKIEAVPQWNIGVTL